MNKEFDIESYIKKINESNTKKEKLENIYGYICKYLDYFYSSNELCEFIDGKCIANRLGVSVHEKDGCCYNIKEGLCRYLVNGECKNKNPACNLFFCSYIEKKYKLKIKIPYINKLLNKKQIEIIRHCYFLKKEEVIDKLLLK